MAATSRMSRRWGSNARKGVQFQTGGKGEGGSGRDTRECYKGPWFHAAKGGGGTTQGCGLPVSSPTSSFFWWCPGSESNPPCRGRTTAPIGKAWEIFLGHVAHWREWPVGQGWERRFPHSERERQGGRAPAAVGAAGVERGESPTTRGPVDAQRVGCPAAILVCRVAPRQEGRPLAKRGLGRRSSTSYALGPYWMSKAPSETDISPSTYSFSLCRLSAMEESKEAWPSLVMMESQHPRHRRRLGPARDEPPSQNRVHGWGSVCCVMRSCPARGHGNQRDRELSRIWTCKSRRCRPPQTGEPATRENIAASRRTTVATTATRLRCCHPRYPCIRVAPSALPVQVWRPRPDWRRRSPSHPLDPDLARRPWSQKCPSTTPPCQYFGPRDTSPTSKIASDFAGRYPRCCDSKLTAVELDGRDGLREPQLPTPSPALATRHLLAETIESGGGAVCGHWFGDVRRQGERGKETSE